MDEKVESKAYTIMHDIIPINEEFVKIMPNKIIFIESITTSRRVSKKTILTEKIELSELDVIKLN